MVGWPRSCRSTAPAGNTESHQVKSGWTKNVQSETHLRDRFFGLFFQNVQSETHLRDRFFGLFFHDWTGGWFSNCIFCKTLWGISMGVLCCRNLVVASNHKWYQMSLPAHCPLIWPQAKRLEGWHRRSAIQVPFRFWGLRKIEGIQRIIHESQRLSKKFLVINLLSSSAMVKAFGFFVRRTPNGLAGHGNRASRGALSSQGLAFSPWEPQTWIQKKSCVWIELQKVWASLHFNTRARGKIWQTLFILYIYIFFFNFFWFLCHSNPPFDTEFKMFLC